MTKKTFLQSKTLKVFFLIFGLICLGIVLFVFYAYLRLFVFDIEQRDFDLDKKLKGVAVQIEDYKTKNGSYPNSLKEVDSEKICSKNIINFCITVHYKIVESGNGFRLAAKSLSWPVLYYHSELSKNQIYTNFAYPYEMRGNGNLDSVIPVYKVTAPIFTNPDEWPEL